jgi:putative polyketide hydroxylase
MSSDPTVGIIGGGPCGLMMALLLARAGVRCVVFEKKFGISTHPKAMGVSRRTSEIYRQLGLIDRIVQGSLSRGDRSLAIWSRTLVGEELGRVPYTEEFNELTPCTGLHCPQTWTEKVLLDAVTVESHAEVKFNCEVLNVVPGDESVRLTLSGDLEIEVPWVIAADGAGSGIRRQLEVETVGPGDMGHFLNVMFRANYGPHLQERLAILYPTFTDDYLEFFVAIDGRDLWLMHHFLQPAESAADFPAERLQSIVTKASGLPDEPVEILSVMPWVMSPKVARRYRVGRILLVGDAAARLSPTGGLGLNTGLQSAHTLAWKLAAIVKGEAGVDLLDTYEQERRDAAFWTMQNTNRNTDEIMDISAKAMEEDWGKVRELIGHSRRRGSGLGQDLGIGYTEGAFVPDDTDAPVLEDPINDYHPAARPGSRAPHLWVERQGKRLSTLDLFGNRFVLLTGSDCQFAKVDTGVLGVLRNRRDFAAGAFESSYGIGGAGAVLVRPDGYVGARWVNLDDVSQGQVNAALGEILCAAR